MRVVITMPVLDDWEGAAILCSLIDAEMETAPNISASIFIVDDGSIERAERAFQTFEAKSLESISVLRLRRNLGHQRAIAIGLAYIEKNISCDVAVVMDADGEDRPEDIARLLDVVAAASVPTAVFAQRGRRIESVRFRLFYVFYRVLHRLLTGRGIRIGNFSALPVEHLRSIVAYAELWNHYAATVVNSRLRYTTVPTDRGKRLHGHSRMNFLALVMHGLSALFAYHEIVSTRFLIGSASLTFISTVLLVAVFFVRFQTSLAIPGWATTAAGLLFVVIVQCMATSVIVLFSAMMNRSSLGFLPVRDFEYFVSGCTVLQKK